jgi:hypothetical protein
MAGKVGRDAKLSDFITWMKEHDVRWKQDVLQLNALNTQATPCNVAVLARRNIKRGDTLCVLPKAALLSVNNSELADVLSNEQIGGGLALTLAVLREMLLGSASQWCVRPLLVGML